ncbi:EthD family reductase [Rhodopseudomonas sp. B29]|uniref:EthD family reductase n=1 Tax=Rhodopseudomonas sp. B29 TaxID=95607 RepID=UPI000345B063|nr:EthD family reductase [Rhodopseudomonas sp. B29]
MHCLTVLYPTPDDPAAFKSYYVKTHVPLAKQLPGLRSCSFGFPAALGPGDAPFCIFQALFDSAEAMGQALQSDIGRKVASDVPNYSPKGAQLLHYAVEG